MHSSQGSNKEKQPVRRAKLKTSATETRKSEQKPNNKEAERPAHKDASTSPMTEEQYRARVSQKAYGLYQKRQAATQLEDWLEAERLVKTELLAEGEFTGNRLTVQRE